MSRENIEVVRQVNDAFNSGDLDRILEFIDPEFETLVPPAFSAEPDTYRGHEGIRRYFDSFQEAMTEIRFHQERFEEVGEEVVVAVRLTARGRTTGILVEQRLGQVWATRDGKVVEVRNYASFSEALDAAGPTE
jgi:hypothetical protein